MLYLPLTASRRNANPHMGNVAIGLSRLGFDVGWLSQVGKDAFGRHIRRVRETEGLDCYFLREDPDHATDLFFKERAADGLVPRVKSSHLSPKDAENVDFSCLRHLPFLRRSRRAVGSGPATC